MGILIDSSVIISSERGALNWSQLVAPLANEPIAISAVTASELLHGVYRAPPARRAAREAFVEGVIANTAVIPFDLPVARVHARLSAFLSQAGQPAGAHHLMIAATAVFIQYRLLTADLRSFPRVPELHVVPIG